MTSPKLVSSESLSSSVVHNRPSGQGRWFIAGGLGILLLGGGVVLWRTLSSGPPSGMQGPPGVPVELAPVQTGTVQDSSGFLGSLEAQAGVVLQPEVAGRITQVFVTAGDRVTPGQPIMLISPDRTQAEADAAGANVTAVRAAREASSASLQSLLSRQAELEAELALEEAEFARTQSLVEQGAQSQQELDLATRNLEVAQANLASARNEIAAQQASLSQSEATLAQAQANQAAAQQNLQDRTVTAPIAGVVGDLAYKLGDYVTPSNTIANITDNATLELELRVPIEQRDRLQIGLPVELLSADGTQTAATGSISFISPQTNADTQTVLIKARFENSEGTLQDSQQVEVRLVWAEDIGILVPTTAIYRIGDATFVYVADAGTPEELPPPEAIPEGMPVPDQVARQQAVTLGDIQGNDYEVLEGLDPGDVVVVSGILNLQNGLPLLPQVEGEPPEAEDP